MPQIYKKIRISQVFLDFFLIKRQKLTYFINTVIPFLPCKRPEGERLM